MNSSFLLFHSFARLLILQTDEAETCFHQHGLFNVHQFSLKASAVSFRLLTRPYFRFSPCFPLFHRMRHRFPIKGSLFLQRRGLDGNVPLVRRSGSAGCFRPDAAAADLLAVADPCAEAERAFLVVEIRPDDPAAESRLSGVWRPYGAAGSGTVSLAVLCPEGGCSREVCLRFCQDHGLSLAQNWHCLAEGFEKEGEMDYNESC